MKMLAVLLFVLSVGGCYQQEEATVRAAGTAVYDGASTGTLVVRLYQSDNERCCGNETCSESVAKRVAEVELAEPGAFSLEGTATWVTARPETFVSAELVDAAGDCLAGGTASIPAGEDGEGLVVTVVDGECVQLL